MTAPIKYTAVYHRHYCVHYEDFENKQEAINFLRTQEDDCQLYAIGVWNNVEDKPAYHFIHSHNRKKEVEKELKNEINHRMSKVNAE